MRADSISVGSLNPPAPMRTRHLPQVPRPWQSVRTSTAAVGDGGQQRLAVGDLDGDADRFNVDLGHATHSRVGGSARAPAGALAAHPIGCAV